MASLAGAMGEDISGGAAVGSSGGGARGYRHHPVPPDERALHEPYLASARSRLGSDTWEGALAEGRAMSLEEAAEYALSKGGRSAGPTTRAIRRRTGRQPYPPRAGSGGSRGPGPHQPPDLHQTRDLRAHRRQPRREDPPQAGPPFPCPGGSPEARRSDPNLRTGLGFPRHSHRRFIGACLGPVAKWA